MRRAGRIGNWNDAKGFGFVAPHDGGPRAFLHIKAFQASARRPVDGDLVSYEVVTGAKGRLNASNVRFAGQRILTPVAAPRRESRMRRPPARIPRIAIGAGALVAVIAAAAMGRMPAALALGAVLMSCASYLMYALDKEVAGRSRWRRTPEDTLHLLDLAGGWPGGLIAQQVARHKTSKASFQRTFRATVLLNLALYGWLWRSGLAATFSEFLLG